MKQSCKTFITTLVTLLTLLSVGQSRAEYEEVIYYHTDALGSPALATKADGTEKWREEYAPYGSRLLLESRETAGTPPVPIESQWDEKQWFTGKLEETRVGLQYFGARWYDPEIGRFLSPDPVQYTQGNIYSFNRYAYANNNPYRYTDPDGESPIDVVFLAVDVGRLAAAVYSGDTSAVQSAAVDVAFSAVGVVVPIPGAGQALKAVKIANKVESAARAASGTKSAVNSAEKVTGYHATDPGSAKAILEGGFLPGTKSGRLGSGGTYVNNTPQGAIAEFATGNPGVTPKVLKVEYNPGTNASASVPPRYKVEQHPLNVDSISAPSVRAPGTTNTHILNGSAKATGALP